MNEEEIRSRILICEIREKEYLEVGNTKTANRYSNEISKWENLLAKINPKRDKELQEYKIGYQKLQQENKELKNINDKLSSALESSENRLDKAIDIISNDTTLNPLRQRKRLINILKGGK